MGCGETCPLCGSSEVSYTWKVGQRDIFHYHDCGAKWTDGRREDAKRRKSVKK